MAAFTSSLNHFTEVLTLASLIIYEMRKRKTIIKIIVTKIMRKRMMMIIMMLILKMIMKTKNCNYDNIDDNNDYMTTTKMTMMMVIS